MPTHKISVTVDPSAIRVTPDPLAMTSADEVHWEGTGPRKFSIVFDQPGAFGKRELSHVEATTRRRPLIRGRFKYTVVAADDPGLRLDPEIIIGDPPTLPPP
jgi:hypothetical protein